jgi:hypothetical protein
MTDEQILDLVLRMRKAQRHFFNVRREGGNDRAALEASKDLERQVDRALAARFAKQGSLL